MLYNSCKNQRAYKDEKSAARLDLMRLQPCLSKKCLPAILHTYIYWKGTERDWKSQGTRSIWYMGSTLLRMKVLVSMSSVTKLPAVIADREMALSSWQMPLHICACSLTHPLSEWEIRAFLTWGITHQMLSIRQNRCCQGDKRDNHINT